MSNSIPSIETAFIPYILQELTHIVAKKKNINNKDALQYVLNSQLYTDMHNPKAKYWYLSSLALYNELEKEKKITKKEFTKEIMLFISFCFENYTLHTSKTKEEVLFLFSTYSIYDYLCEVFSALHTQGAQYIVEEIEMVIKERQKK